MSVAQSKDPLVQEKTEPNSSGPILKMVGRKLLPRKARRALWWSVNKVNEWRANVHSTRLRHRLNSIKSSNTTQKLLHYSVRIHKGSIFYMLYDDIFVKRIYHFEAKRPDPLVLDLGSHIGISILYFKYIYPQARIIGFEPDPALYSYLDQNIVQNSLTDVQVVHAALGSEVRTVTFCSDSKIGSSLIEHRPGMTKYELPCVRLRDYLTEPVDFLKMNIEGAEWEVLADSEDRLHHVREMVIEYHHWPNLERTLHKILALLHKHHFEYVVSDFGLETYGGARPDARLCPETRYYRQIYACKKS